MDEVNYSGHTTSRGRCPGLGQGKHPNFSDTETVNRQSQKTGTRPLDGRIPGRRGTVGG